MGSYLPSGWIRYMLWRDAERSEEQDKYEEHSIRQIKRFLRKNTLKKELNESSKNQIKL